MIGYNIEKINDLTGAIKAAYKDLGDAMGTGWPNVSTTLETQWIGPDEVHFEKTLAKRICDLYTACMETVQTSINNIKSIGDSWKAFQEKNILKAAEGAEAIAAQTLGLDIATVTVDAIDISGIVKSGEPTFTVDMKLGVAEGETSATKINEAINTYVGDIKEKVSTLFNAIKSEEAFLGGDQATNIDSYLGKISTEVQKLSTTVDDLQTNLTSLVNAYTQQATAINTGISNAEVGGDQTTATPVQGAPVQGAK